jgi:hypothetical protein
MHARELIEILKLVDMIRVNSEVYFINSEGAISNCINFENGIL